MTRPPQTELRKATDLYSGYVWPFICFWLGRESASIWPPNLNAQDESNGKMGCVGATNGEYEVKVNGYTGKVIIDRRRLVCCSGTMR
jgi:hypothetical protein